MTISDLKKEIKHYKPYNEQEKKDQKFMLQYIDQFKEASLLRACVAGHFTTSVFLFNHDHSKVLMCYHIIDDSWAWLGGHADGLADLRQVVKREIVEESGISRFKLTNNEDIAGLTCIAIPGHVKNGKYVSSHVHLDVAFVGEADESEELTILPSENEGLAWIDVDSLADKVTDTWKVKRTYLKLIEQYR